MKKIVTLLAISISILSHSQTEIDFIKSGASVEDIIPQNWKVLDVKYGDLNQDGIEDVVFAVQDTNPNNVEINNGLGMDSIDLNPRVLGIYFGTKKALYQQQLISNNFIILRDSPTMDEPFDGFDISDKGILSINFHFWFSAGSWTMSNHNYKFRFQNNEFALIGYESEEVHRASGDTKDYSINFLSKKMKITSGNISNEEPSTVEWQNFHLEKLKTLTSIGTPFNWELNGVYL